MDPTISQNGFPLNVLRIHSRHMHTHTTDTCTPMAPWIWIGGMRRGTVRKQQLGATGLRPGEGKQGATLSTPQVGTQPGGDPRTNKWRDRQGQQHGTTQPQSDMKGSVGTEEHMLRRPL